MRTKFSFDTNILIYAAEQDNAGKNLIARDLIRDSHANDAGAITEQSVTEFLSAATRKGNIPFRDAAAYVQDILELFDLLLARQDIVHRTLDVLSRHRLSVWDARMVALCGTHDYTVLFSEDMQDHGLYDGVRVINPFRSSNRNIVEEVLNS
jgi:predicted nucleic acid-binding protein